MYEAILYEGELKLHMTYRTGGTDAVYNHLDDLLERSDIVLSDADLIQASNLLLYLSCTQDMEFARVTESPQLDAIEAVWQFFDDELRIVNELMPGVFITSIKDKPEKVEELYLIMRHTLPQKFINEMWRVAWSQAQKTLYPATSDVKPEAELTEEQQADDFLENGVQDDAPDSGSK
ncbi:MAG: hypothetical protein ACPG7F_00380 [Aggregatilineales bacterium]